MFVSRRSITLGFLCTAGLTFGGVVPAFSQQPPAEKPAAPARAEVLVLGTVYPVDADGEFPYQRLVNYAKVSDWFRRNMRIYGNVMQLVGSPNERVLVIFGAGHLGWLRHDFAGNPDLRLRTLSEFVR